MKKIIIIAITALAACRSEKEISKKPDAPLIAHIQYLQAVHIGNFEKNYDLSKGASEEQQYMNEILLNNLPKDQADVLQRWPSPEQFQTYYNQQQNILSASAMAHLSRLFLLSYAPWQQPYNPQLANLAGSHLQRLADKKFTGYALAYNMLAWLKTGGAAVAAPLLQQILSYAKPVFIPKDPSRPDSPELENYPEMKKSLVQFAQAVEENNTALEKLRGL